MQSSLSLDDFVMELLDKVLKKLQHKTMNAMGPLSKEWKTLENAMNMKCQKVEITLEYLKY